jgi:hypothetical protein
LSKRPGLGWFSFCSQMTLHLTSFSLSMPNFLKNNFLFQISHAKIYPCISNTHVYWREFLINNLNVVVENPCQLLQLPPSQSGLLTSANWKERSASFFISVSVSLQRLPVSLLGLLKCDEKCNLKNHLFFSFSEKKKGFNKDKDCLYEKFIRDAI